MRLSHILTDSAPRSSPRCAGPISGSYSAQLRHRRTRRVAKLRAGTDREAASSVGRAPTNSDRRDARSIIIGCPQKSTDRWQSARGASGELVHGASPAANCPAMKLVGSLAVDFRETARGDQ